MLALKLASGYRFQRYFRNPYDKFSRQHQRNQKYYFSQNDDLGINGNDNIIEEKPKEKPKSIRIIPVQRVTASKSNNKIKNMYDMSLRYIPDEIEYKSGKPNKNPYLVLGIETSCDDTGIAIVSSDGKILSNIIINQYDIHEKFGGIVPRLAFESHKKNIDIAIEQALFESKINFNDIDVISVTKGPGLEPCLSVGFNKALVNIDILLLYIFI